MSLLPGEIQLSSRSPADAFSSNYVIIRQALQFYNNRLTGIIESEEIKDSNNFVREDLFEYLNKSQSILSDLSKPESDFNEWYRHGTHILRANENFVGFVLSSYKRYLEQSETTAIQKLNYDDLEHPDVKFVNLKRQIGLVEQARQDIENRYY